MGKYEILKVIVGKEFIIVKYGEFCKRENGDYIKVYRITRKMVKASKNVFEFMRKTKSTTDKNGNYIYKAEIPTETTETTGTTETTETTETKNKKEVKKMKKNNYREFSVNGIRYFVANSNGNYNGKYMLLQFSTHYNAWICVGHYANTIKAVKDSVTK